jgi:hypothetical protein
VKSTIFQNKTEMPPKDNSPDVVRTAQTMAEMHKNYLPAAMPNKDASVENVQRPRRGHGY